MCRCHLESRACGPSTLHVRRLRLRQDAVMSLHTYVAQSSFFAVLAPAQNHENGRCISPEFLGMESCSGSGGANVSCCITCSPRRNTTSSHALQPLPDPSSSCTVSCDRLMNYVSWKRRGWCQFELSVNVLLGILGAVAGTVFLFISHLQFALTWLYCLASLADLHIPGSPQQRIPCTL